MRKEQIRLDSRNVRVHDERNKQAIAKSLKELGAGRSILIDSENVVIGGNGVFQEAQEIGLPVKVIESDGTELIAIKRTDLKTEDAKRKALAIADNRTNDLSFFDEEKLAGNIDTYTISFTDESTFSFNVVNGEKGDPGDDLRIDATGELTERDAYGNESAGFLFCATETNAQTGITKLYLYAKKTDAYNDWCNLFLCFLTFNSIFARCKKLIMLRKSFVHLL